MPELREGEALQDAARRVAIDAIYTARDADRNMHQAGADAADAVLDLAGTHTPYLLAVAARFAREHDGTFVTGYSRGEWSVTLTWGKEAADSPMAAAQAIGCSELLPDALRQMLDEARIQYDDG